MSEEQKVYTANYPIQKPRITDFYDIDVPNSNMDVIDGELKKAEDHRENPEIHVTAADKAGWNSAVEDEHTHSNKSTLDGVTSTKVANWNTAYTHTGNRQNPHGVTAAQVGARPQSWMPSASDVGAAPASHVSDSTKHITSSERTTWNAKVAKSALRTATLYASSWAGSEPPYTYSLSVSGVTTTSVQEILPTTSATEEQIIALQAANMQDGGQTAGKITVKAWGDKPEIDLPVRIIIRGDL
ncbi:hypothetical protein H8711_11195 [Clostridiaceae bacterium NSJ-31]|uniref:Uncharacterized protein n=1 Tax=Ligaoa zhengdingensis TaxID=2763658 RepID=A0A926I5I0_9FIRM|nr:hypothetical protein [Ligaoa zhengdingensis]MBC8547490.1 hypothetical protein [Ligaoa zhengdingensis]